jgi:hypothetical protein
MIEPACADTCLRRSRDRQAADRQPAVVRQIRDHLGIALPSRAYRSPPSRSLSSRRLPPTLVLTRLAAGGSVPADSDSRGFSPLG